jgi:hypothetical protein
VSELPADVIVRQLQAVLREAVDGPSESWTYFIDNRPGAGLLGALAAVSAVDASRAVGGSTIAAHAYHVAFAMRASADSVSGDSSPRDWNESWRVKTVDERAWTALLEDLGRAREALRSAIGSHAVSTEVGFGEAVAAIAHIGYHLGAIRQKIVTLRAL